MMKNKPNPRTVSSKKYQEKAGYVAKSYKLKRDIVERFAKACKTYNISQSRQLTNMMEEFIRTVESSTLPDSFKKRKD